MIPTPCRLCGYDAPGTECPHCNHRSTLPSLTAERVGMLQGIIDGGRAVPVGFKLLLSTKGVKRFLVPPVLITTIAFLGLFWWALGLVDLLVQAVEIEDMAELGLEEGWFKVAVVWLLEKGVASALARISGVFLWIVVSSVVSLYTFSVVYEAVAGPFLDEIQGRMECKWFGNNPRDELERPTTIPVKRCLIICSLAGAGSLALLLAPLPPLSGVWSYLALLRVTLPFVLAAAIDRQYGIWLGWVLRVEGHLLWVSLKASLVVLFTLLLFFPLKFVPLVGFPLFMAIAGFGTAITLLDIPFSRRRWSFGQRFRFMMDHLPPMLAFGLVASLVFLVPIIGPIVLVPSASIGGLWLVLRLDKQSLRPQTRSSERQDPSLSS
ncbi:MAG: hypothetical protein ACI9F9_003416 [Candidatus Paceibacteria bacterium]|jgi:uncharacterized protein involved in cysteine biosynthesis